MPFMMNASVELWYGVDTSTIATDTTTTARTASRRGRSLATVNTAITGPTAESENPYMYPAVNRKHAVTMMSVGHGATRRSTNGSVVNARAT